jgi:hypothetical protein
MTFYFLPMSSRNVRMSQRYLQEMGSMLELVTWSRNYGQKHRQSMGDPKCGSGPKDGNSKAVSIQGF